MNAVEMLHNMIVIAALAAYMAASFRLKKYLKALAAK